MKISDAQQLIKLHDISTKYIIPRDDTIHVRPQKIGNNFHKLLWLKQAAWVFVAESIHRNQIDKNINPVASIQAPKKSVTGQTKEQTDKSKLYPLFKRG